MFGDEALLTAQLLRDDHPSRLGMDNILFFASYSVMSYIKPEMKLYGTISTFNRKCGVPAYRCHEFNALWRDMKRDIGKSRTINNLLLTCSSCNIYSAVNI